jgi:hypothetical protein
MLLKPILLMTLFIALPFATSLAAPAPEPVPGCNTAESRQFDFWVGDWKATWEQDKSGFNRITKTHNGCVIREEFNGAPGSPLIGTSLSTYDSQRKKWKQTWVDNYASYLDFEGAFRDGKMILSRAATKNGKPTVQRMVWYNIEKGSFDWNWEASEDQGKTWKVNWKIHYTRTGIAN